MQTSSLDSVINALAWFEMNEERLTDGLPELRYENAKSKYDYLNGQLNIQWGNLSSNMRQKMKKDALKWIAFKNKQCDDIKLVQSDTLSLQEKKRYMIVTQVRLSIGWMNSISRIIINGME